MMGGKSPETAYLAPFAVFLLLLLLGELVARLGDGYAFWTVAQPQYWIFPVQTLICGALVWHWRGRYPLQARGGMGVAAAAGLLALGVWVAPQWLLGFSARTGGFEPGYFGGGAAYGLNLGFRLVRMVVVVPMVEEIFWRGWLLRFLVKERFEEVPVGTLTAKAFVLSSLAFCLEHQRVDWPAALVTGALYNLVAWRTKSLPACIVAHAVTNAGLAAYVLATRQWGFW